MNYADLKTQFKAILNRRDVTPTLVETFMGMGIQRIHREVRIPAMEKKALFTTDGTAYIDVPGDLLEIIALTYETSYQITKLVRVDYQTAYRASMQPGDPKVYTRDVNKYVLGPYPPAGIPIFYNYYADASTLAADTDHNWMTDATPDLLIYAALTYAGDYFLDERLQRFENRYIQISETLQGMAQQDELENASISPQWSC